MNSRALLSLAAANKKLKSGSSSGIGSPVVQSYAISVVLLSSSGVGLGVRLGVGDVLGTDILGKTSVVVIGLGVGELVVGDGNIHVVRTTGLGVRCAVTVVVWTDVTTIVALSVTVVVRTTGLGVTCAVSVVVTIIGSSTITVITSGDGAGHDVVGGGRGVAIAVKVSGNIGVACCSCPRIIDAIAALSKSRTVARRPHNIVAIFAVHSTCRKTKRMIELRKRSMYSEG